MAVVCATVLGLGTITVAPSIGADPSPSATVLLPARLVADFGSRTFTESVTLGPDGVFYVSVTHMPAKELTHGHAQAEAVSRFGERVPFGPVFETGGMHGLAFDPDGNLYLALVSGVGVGSIAPPSSVVRLAPDGTATTLATLTAEDYPNGLAWHAGDLYVTDSAHGRILRLPGGMPVTGEPVVWIADPLLLPGARAVGVNGIAFTDQAVVVSNTSEGTIIRFPIGPDGGPGPAEVIASDPMQLYSADGLAFAPDGTLWIAVDHGHLMRLAPDGRLSRAPLDALQGPTQPVLTPDGARLYVSDATFDNAPSQRSTLVWFDLRDVPAGS